MLFSPPFLHPHAGFGESGPACFPGIRCPGEFHLDGTSSILLLPGARGQRAGVVSIWPREKDRAAFVAGIPCRDVSARSDLIQERVSRSLLGGRSLPPRCSMVRCAGFMGRALVHSQPRTAEHPSSALMVCAWGCVEQDSDPMCIICSAPSSQVCSWPSWK